MTDHELAITFTEFFNVFQTHYVAHVSVLFAFLIASYLIAHRLRLMMVVVILAIYSLFTLDSIMVIAYMNSDITDIQRMMHDRVANGSEALTFHAAARMDFDPWLLDFFTGARVVILIGSYIGSIWFFFYQRSHAGRY